MSEPDRIARALLTPGGHLSIGRGGYTLHYDNSRLSGYNCDEMKAEAIAAGLPVIDTRHVPFAIVAKMAVHGPMIAVNQIARCRALARLFIGAARCGRDRLPPGRR